MYQPFIYTMQVHLYIYLAYIPKIDLQIYQAQIY